MQNEPNRCPNCGYTLKSGANFCNYCGRQVVAVPAVQPAPQVPPVAQVAPPSYTYPEQYPIQPVAQMSSQDARNWAVFSHLASFIGFIIPFGDLAAKLVIYFSKKDQSAFLADHAKEALNQMITFYIALLIILPFTCVYIGIPFLIALFVFEVVVSIIAAVKASNGETYRYPLIFRFIK